MSYRRHTRLARGLAAGALAAIALAVPAAAAQADDDVPYCGTVPHKVPPKYWWPVDPPRDLTELLSTIKQPEVETNVFKVVTVPTFQP